MEQSITTKLQAIASNIITMLIPCRDMNYQLMIRQNHIETGNIVVLQTVKFTESTIEANLKHAVSNNYYSRDCTFFVTGY